jgi:hypothetical protein
MRGWKRAFVSLPSGLVVECEIAATIEDRERGFNGRRRPPYGFGILFVFPQLVLSPFTMQRTEFPLDMVFMRGEPNEHGAVPAEVVQIVNASLSGRRGSTTSVSRPRRDPRSFLDHRSPSRSSPRKSDLRSGTTAPLLAAMTRCSAGERVPQRR